MPELHGSTAGGAAPGSGETMDVLVVQHMTTGSAGALGTALRAAGLGLDTRDLESGAALPAADADHAALVVLGGVMNAADDARYPHLAATAGLISAFHARGKPVLGVCLGAQLIARAFAARVWRGRTPETGFVALDITAAGRRDALLAGLASPQWLMQWHDDSFDLPAGAELLMTGARCRNQAFRLGRATYGFQGHFEVTRELLRRWLDESASVGYGHAHPGFYARIDDEIAVHIAASLRFCETVARRWAGLVAARAGA
ncbi:MAG: type 1 glutamine amidotransferase [Alphaproteobacteria bacterium]